MSQTTELARALSPSKAIATSPADTRSKLAALQSRLGLKTAGVPLDVAPPPIDASPSVSSPTSNPNAAVSPISATNISSRFNLAKLVRRFFFVFFCVHCFLSWLLHRWVLGYSVISACHPVLMIL
jgi:hypothetical protein